MADLYPYSYTKLIVDIDALSIQIKQDPVITGALHHIDWGKTKSLVVYFNTELSANAKTRLDEIVGDYAGDAGGCVNVYCSDCDAWSDGQLWVKDTPQKCPICKGKKITCQSTQYLLSQSGSATLNGVKSIAVDYKVPFLRSPRVRVFMPVPGAVTPVIKNQSLKGFVIDFQTEVKDTTVEWEAVVG